MEAGADMAKPQGIDTPEGIARVLRDVPGPFVATLSQATGVPQPVSTPDDDEPDAEPVADVLKTPDAIQGANWPERSAMPRVVPPRRICPPGRSTSYASATAT